MVASHTPPTRDLAHNQGMGFDWGLNSRPFSLQAGTQSTEPYQPGLNNFFYTGISVHFIPIFQDLQEENESLKAHIQEVTQYNLKEV